MASRFRSRRSSATANARPRASTSWSAELRGAHNRRIRQPVDDTAPEHRRPGRHRMRTTLCKGLFLLAWLGVGPLATAQEVVKIAFIDVLSGPFAQAGEGSLKQLREVVIQLNAKSAPTDPKFEV